MATTAQSILVNQVSGGEKNIIHRMATAYHLVRGTIVALSQTLVSYLNVLTIWSNFSTPGQVAKCFVSSSTSSGMADWVLDCVSTLNEYCGLLLTILVVYFLPPGPLLTDVVVMAEPGEFGLFDLAISLWALQILSHWARNYSCFVLTESNLLHCRPKERWDSVQSSGLVANSKHTNKLRSIWWNRRRQRPTGAALLPESCSSVVSQEKRHKLPAVVPADITRSQRHAH